MNIRWRSIRLPAYANRVGHGYCFCVLAPNERFARLVAFVEGFDWCHEGQDVVILFDRRRVHSTAQWEELKNAIEARVRTRDVGEIDITADVRAFANA